MTKKKLRTTPKEVLETWRTGRLGAKYMTLYMLQDKHPEVTRELKYIIEILRDRHQTGTDVTAVFQTSYPSGTSEIYREIKRLIKQAFSVYGKDDKYTKHVLSMGSHYVADVLIQNSETQKFGGRRFWYPAAER
ncbi:MAG: hypothetical protein V1802_00205 [Candidatus Aenigmatarchaeota archaeon]